MGRLGLDFDWAIGGSVCRFSILGGVVLVSKGKRAVLLSARMRSWSVIKAMTYLKAGSWEPCSFHRGVAVQKAVLPLAAVSPLRSMTGPRPQWPLLPRLLSIKGPSEPERLSPWLAGRLESLRTRFVDTGRSLACIPRVVHCGLDMSRGAACTSLFLVLRCDRQRRACVERAMNYFIPGAMPVAIRLRGKYLDSDCLGHAGELVR